MPSELMKKIRYGEQRLTSQRSVLEFATSIAVILFKIGLDAGAKQIEGYI
jgi:hypothetical protein